MAAERMRWGLVCAAALALAATPAQGQRTVSLVVGPTFADINSEDFPGSKTTTGAFAALGTSIRLGGVLALEPYVAYVQKGARFESETSPNETVSYDYVQIPVLLAAALPLSEHAAVRVAAGPQFGFQVKCEEPLSIEGGDCSEFEDHKRTEFGIVATAGVGFGIAEDVSLAIGVGADYGLTDIYDEVDYKTKTYMAYVALVRTVRN
jgi:hypothetical protein